MGLGYYLIGILIIGTVHALPPLVAAFGVGSRKAVTVASVLSAVAAILSALLPMIDALVFVLLGLAGGSWVVKRRGALSIVRAEGKAEASPKRSFARPIVAAFSYLLIAMLLLLPLLVSSLDAAVKNLPPG